MLQAEQQFAPALFAFAIAVQNRDPFLATICCGTDQHEHALLFMGIVLDAIEIVLKEQGEPQSPRPGAHSG